MNSRNAEVAGVKDQTVTLRLEDGRILTLRLGDPRLRGEGASGAHMAATTVPCDY